ncbi:pentatricopeptide repeat-containing protein At4g25270, chloroplastic [Magnolia sinica]|uniref:pentatricopeptide repeat-containing protein At4g25270, chloroplastic n=1 Tax=Magnolia sinica TaxID=86752 RepID=UPI00265B7010|nr:pentatricopeptide repeat-containing protein At4g25270, chloroplastic [Magnolia sinica]
METLQAFPPISFCLCSSSKTKKIKRRQLRNHPQQSSSITTTATTITDLSSFSKPSSPTPLLVNQSPQSQTKHQALDQIVQEIRASLDRHIKIEPKIYSSLLETCFRMQSLHHGIIIHRLIPPTLLRKSVDLSSKLLRLYASFGLVDEAHKLFDRMPQRHATAFAWNSLISGYAELGLYEDAMALYYQMEEDKVEPDRFTFPRVLKACAGLGSIQVGEAVHRHIVRSGFADDPFVLNALIDMYAKCGDIVGARKVFDTISHRDMISWNSMLVGYARHGLLVEALCIFRQMTAAGFEPDSVAISTILTRFAASRLGLEIHSWVIRRGLDQNLSVANSLISMYGVMGQLHHAFEVFEGMGERDTVSWNAIISAHGKHGRQALMIFQQMENSGVSPDDITFISLLSACAHSGAVEEGRQLFAKMEETYGIKPWMEHCACMVNLLGRAGFIDEAYDFITKRMAFEGGPTVWGALLHACSVHGNVGVGEIAAERLFELEPDNAHNFDLMMKIYVDAGRWEDEERVRKMMRNRGLDT